MGVLHGMTMLLILEHDFPLAPKDVLIDSLVDILIAGLAATLPLHKNAPK